MQLWPGEYPMRQSYANRLHGEAREYGLLVLTNFRLVFQVQGEDGWIRDTVDLGLDRVGNVLVTHPMYGPPCVQVYSAAGATQFRVDDPMGLAQTIVNARAALAQSRRPAAPSPVVGVPGVTPTPSAPIPPPAAPLPQAGAVCRGCGQPRAPSAAFCSRCGAPV
jgi:hypothetical protein